MEKKKEQFFCIGFGSDKNKLLSFCLTPQISDKIFYVSAKRNSWNEFEKAKKNIRLTYVSKKDILVFTEDDILSVANVGKEKIISVFKNEAKSKKLAIFSAKNLGSWVFKGIVPAVKEPGIIVPDFKYKNKYALLSGETDIRIAYSADLKKWTKLKEPVLKPRPAFFDNERLRIIAAEKIDTGTIIFYDSSKRDGDAYVIRIGAAILSGDEGKNIVWRSNTPILEERVDAKNLFCKGIVFAGSQAISYWINHEGKVFAFSFYNQFSGEKAGKALKRFEKNPIISPIGKKWHLSGTFNPTALNTDGKIHLVYRAIGEDGVSKFGYAETKDGLHIRDVYPGPIFALREPRKGIPENKKIYSFMMYPSGGSWGGAEDPRIVKIGEKIYLTFNSFENWDSIRVAMTSITDTDFKNKNWNWSDPVMISPSKEVNKNWVMFPEKIHGKFAILHSISPNVQVEYVDNFDGLASGRKKIKSTWVKDGGPKNSWDTFLRGVGPAPLRTKDGWLVFYHATNKIGGGYAMGAMLLDLKNPEKIIARSASPILLPDMWYEHDWKPNVVYACGSVIKNDTVYVYYGGGDKHVCVATAPLQQFIKNLKEHKQINFIVKEVTFA